MFEEKTYTREEILNLLDELLAKDEECNADDFSNLLRLRLMLAEWNTTYKLNDEMLDSLKSLFLLWYPWEYFEKLKKSITGLIDMHCLFEEIRGKILYEIGIHGINISDLGYTVGISREHLIQCLLSEDKDFSLYLALYSKALNWQ